jgi:hypothetical protein
VVRLAGILLLGLAAASALGAEPNDRQRWAVHLDLVSSSATSAADAWLSGGVGKLRYDAHADGANLARLLVEYDARLTPQWGAHLVVDYLDDPGGTAGSATSASATARTLDSTSGLGATEAYLQWRPLPRPAFRQRLKIGAFYPPFSLENGGPGWTSPYTTSSSAINTWIGVELRTLGAEWRLERPLGPPGSERRVAWYGALFLGNDPAGALLAWTGWAVHDRQTRLGETLPLPPVPQIQPGRLFGRQAAQGEPFVETDDSPGFYVGAEWRQNGRLQLGLAHYDNHADPMSLRRGQYGWRTRFDAFGAQLELPGRLGIVAQWLAGSTAMGPRVGGAHVVEAPFEAYFALLTRDFGPHRVSVRYDDFAVADRDSTPEDRNDESGTAFTLAYRYAPSARWYLSLEWLEIATDRPAWAYFGLPGAATERSVRAGLGLRLGPAP